MTIPARVHSIDDELTHLLGEGWSERDHLRWPPNIFAACWMLLEISGTYTRVLDGWPRRDSVQPWPAHAREVGHAWLACAIEFLSNRTSTPPPHVTASWEKVLTARAAPVDAIPDWTCDALLELLAFADEASAGFGLPLPEGLKNRQSHMDGFYRQVQIHLSATGSLAVGLPSASVCVLPKQHTPRYGLTMRSLSHHLAVFTGGEVKPVWSTPLPGGEGLNLLIVPWPFVVEPSQFSPTRCPHAQPVVPFQCFDYSVRRADELIGDMAFEDWLRSLFLAASRDGERVHGVVFPEASLLGTDFLTVDKVALEFDAFVVAGVSSTRPHDGMDRDFNEVWMTFGVDDRRGGRPFVQAKHHRWQLDSTQIATYGIDGSLDSSFRWWESTPVMPRELNFMAAVDGMMTICCLICEDLARQDPISRLVRAVGPNLVIALLADGPQLERRWPGRYATVLADDPGSAVLTVTSLGMAHLSRPRGVVDAGSVIALWKDPVTGSQEITLEPGAGAVLLTLKTTEFTEYTADGRNDGGAAGFPTLTAKCSIFVN